jgi:hypothetical protein
MSSVQIAERNLDRFQYIRIIRFIFVLKSVRLNGEGKTSGVKSTHASRD